MVTPSRAASGARSIEAASVAGLVFAVLSFIALYLVNSAPDLSAPDSEILAWYSDEANRTSLTVGLSLSVVSAISFLWFVAVIRRRIGDSEDKFFATVFLGSGLLLIGVMLAGAAALAGPAVTVDLADGRVPDLSVMSAMAGFGTSLLLIVLPRLQAVFMMSTSTVTLRSGAFRRSLAFFGYGLALMMFFTPFLYEPLGLAFPGWVGILSVAMLIRKREIIPTTESTGARTGHEQGLSADT